MSRLVGVIDSRAALVVVIDGLDEREVIDEAEIVGLNNEKLASGEKEMEPETSGETEYATEAVIIDGELELEYNGEGVSLSLTALEDV